MQEVVIKVNKQTKCQAQNNPTMKESLSSEVGWLEVGPVAQCILNGSYSPSGHLLSFTLGLISELQQNDAAK
jgi:hypothetical protein